MAIKFVPIRYLDFSGGQNDKVVNHLMLDSEVRLARNCNLDEIGALKKRKGYSQIGTQITAGTNILGNYYFTDKDTTNSQHLTACGDSSDSKVDVYYNNAGTWTKVTGITDWTPETKVRFESFLDYVFAFNGTDTTKDWSGTGSAGTTNLTSAPIGKYGKVYRDRLYFANVTNHPSRVQFSSVGTLATALTWTSTDWLDVNPEDGDSITGLEVNNNRLIVFKNNSTYRWDGRSIEAEAVIDVGTSSQESVKTLNGITYFFNRYGVYAYDGGMPYLISRKVQKWIDAINQSRLSDVSAEVDVDHYYLSIGDVTVDDESYTNAWLIYNIPLKGWTIWTTASESKVLGHYYSSGARYVSFGDDNGKVMRINNGNSDDGSAIPVNIETKAYDLQIAEEEKKFTEVYVITDKGRGFVEVGAKLDNFPVETIGFTTDDVARLPSNLQGKKVAITLSESGTSEEWSFQQLIFRDVMPLGTV